MSKYIIDTDQFEKLFETKAVAVLGIGDNPAAPEEGEKTVWTRTLNVADLEELTSDYINEHFGELQQDAYDRGYKDGRNVTETQAHDEAYQRGLDDAWEAAKKIVLNSDEGGLDSQELDEVFNCATIQQVFRRYNTLSEVIAKLKAYEEKQKAEDEIKVGDEVVDSSGEKGLVVSDGNKCSDTIWLLINGYRVPQSVCKEDYTKTGRHFDIASILEAMKHD